MAGELSDVTTGAVITASHINNIKNRSVMRYADTAERTSLVASPNQGDVAYMEDSDELCIYDGSEWRCKTFKIDATDGDYDSGTYTSFGSPTSYISLASASWITGGAVQVTLDTDTKALVHLSALLRNDTAGAITVMSFAVSGATTLGASDARSIQFESNAANDRAEFGTTILLDSLTAGSNTFDIEAKVTAGTGSISRPRIIVQPL